MLFQFVLVCLMNVVYQPCKWGELKKGKTLWCDPLMMMSGWNKFPHHSRESNNKWRRPNYPRLVTARIFSYISIQCSQYELRNTFLNWQMAEKVWILFFSNLKTEIRQLHSEIGYSVGSNPSQLVWRILCVSFHSIHFGN